MGTKLSAAPTSHSVAVRARGVTCTMGSRRTTGPAVRTAAIALVALGCLAIVGPATAQAASMPDSTVPAPPVARSAPYEYLGWGSPQAPAQVLAATGLHDVTLAFILSHGSCNPEWDGSRPLAGGTDAAAIAAIRAGGGDVDVSFGGWSGKKLGTSCRTVPALAAAYLRVIDAYGLRAVDVDIEHTEFTKATTRERVVAALAAVQQADPGLEISITFETAPSGPTPTGAA